MNSLICNPKVVIFDFNGTLIDDLHVAYGSVKEIFKTYDIPCPRLEQYREEITADFMEFYYRYGFPKTTTMYDLNLIKKKFYRESGNGVQIRTGVHLTLLWLLASGFNTAIVSAEITTTLHRYLVANGLQRNFDFIRAEAWGDKSKALLQAAEVFDCSPEKMMYVDDTVDGLTAARNAGVIPVAFANQTGYNSKHRLAEVTEFSIQEMVDLNNLIKVKLSLL